MWKTLKNLRDLEKDDVLELVNLQTRRSAIDYVLPTVSVFGLGLLVGAGLGLLLAPKSGSELRDDLRAKLQSGQEHLASGLSSNLSSANSNSNSNERLPRGI
ncbi:MAG: YtxH domain-containing protein [Myxococcaceae bacterium]